MQIYRATIYLSRVKVVCIRMIEQFRLINVQHVGFGTKYIPNITSNLYRVTFRPWMNKTHVNLLNLTPQKHPFHHLWWLSFRDVSKQIHQKDCLIFGDNLHYLIKRCASKMHLKYHNVYYWEFQSGKSNAWYDFVSDWLTLIIRYHFWTPIRNLIHVKPILRSPILTAVKSFVCNSIDSYLKHSWFEMLLMLSIPRYHHINSL